MNKIKMISLNHIDKDNDVIIHKNININDAKNYINDLADKMLNSSNMREYKIKTDPNPIISQIKNIIVDIYQPESQSESAASSENNTFSPNNPEYIICDRLLQAQKTAQIRYHQITTIKKGSLIQSLIENDSELIYLIALVEHSSFIDESDLVKKMGLPDSTTATLKSVRIHFDSSLNLNKIFLSDSKNKISEYWYDGFLDLIETVNDVTNTKRAYNFIKGILSSKLSKKYKQDHLEYTMGLNTYFSHNKTFNLNECLDFVFSTEPINAEINIDDLKDEIIRKKENSNTFDNVFNVDDTDIKNLLKNKKYTLNSNVELKIKTSTDKIKDSIYTYKLDNGQVILAIQNVDKKELDRFNFYNIDF